jgi:O-antigen/teichoic acid export membrane protein
MTQSNSAEPSQSMAMRVGLTTVDQGICSVSNVAVAIVVARIAGVGGLGAFSVVYAGWLAIVAMHRALITDPMAIEGDLRKTDAIEHVRAGLAAELLLGVGGGAIFALIGVALVAGGSANLGYPFLAVAPWLPFLLAQDYWRWVGFMKADPAKSLANDVVFDILQGITFGLLFVFGIRSSVLAITAWCASAGAGAVFGLWQFGVHPTWRGGRSRLRLRWRLGKWLAGVSASSWGATQATMLLAGGFLGTVGLGGLKSATTLVSGPALVLIQAGGSVGLPEASRGLSERGWPGLRRVCRVLTAACAAAMVLIFVVVFFFGKELLGDVYGPAFSRFAPVASIYALSCCVGSLGLGAIISMKATRQPRLLFRVSLVSLVSSAIAVCALTPSFGIDGAAWGMVIANAVTTAFQLANHWRHSRPEAEALFASAASVAMDPHSATPEPDPAEQGVHLSAEFADESERSPELVSPASTSFSSGVNAALAEVSNANQHLLSVLNNHGRKDELS